MPHATDQRTEQPAEIPAGGPLNGYQLRVVREVLLALLAGEASHGYQLRARLALALGPLAGALNDGQVYVTLNRLEKAGLVTSERVGQAEKPDRRVYELTTAGRDQVTEWLEDTIGQLPDVASVHTDSGLEFQVVAQKIIVYTSILNLATQAYGLRRAAPTVV